MNYHLKSLKGGLYRGLLASQNDGFHILVVVYGRSGSRKGTGEEFHKLEAETLNPRPHSEPVCIFHWTEAVSGGVGATRRFTGNSCQFRYTGVSKLCFISRNGLQLGFRPCTLNLKP